MAEFCKDMLPFLKSSNERAYRDVLKPAPNIIRVVSSGEVLVGLHSASDSTSPSETSVLETAENAC